MATNIPPHNLGEVIDATIHLLDNPDADPRRPDGVRQGPDFPTGGQIMGRAGIVDAYRTGRGSDQDARQGRDRRGQDERHDRGHRAAVSGQRVGDRRKIKELVDHGELDGIADINDVSARARPASTSSSSATPRPGGPQQPLQAHAAADDVLDQHGGAGRRRAPHAQPARRARGLRRAPGRGHHATLAVPPRQGARRAHILEGLIKALDVIDEIIALIRASTTRPPPAKASWATASSSPRFRPNTSSTCSSAAHPARPQRPRDEMADSRRHRRARGDPRRRGRLFEVIKDELGEVRDEFADAARSSSCTTRARSTSRI